MIAEHCEDGSVVLRSVEGAIKSFPELNITLGLTQVHKCFQMWMNHHEHLTYSRIESEHTSDPTKVLNLFTGLEIPREESIEGEVDPILDHILNIWCNGDVSLYEYGLNWMAFKVQCPGIKMKTAIVLYGAQGAEKGIVVSKLEEVLGKKYCLHVRM